MEEFRRKNIPVSWVLLDDGWSDVDRKNGTLRSFGADPSRFPKGLSHTVRLLKDEFGVKYVGVWQAFQSYWNGVDPNGEVARRMKESLTRITARRPGRVIRPESGDVRLLQAGESISERVSYGEAMVFEEYRLSRSSPAFISRLSKRAAGKKEKTLCIPLDIVKFTHFT